MDLTAPIQFASSVLFRLSGRQWPGVCEQTVWPCQGNSCSGGGDPAWSALAASDWHFGQSAPSIPYRTGDGWANCWDCGESVGSGICGGGCYLPSVTIPGVIQGITEIVVHGQRLPRNAYAIKDRGVFRLDGASFPCSNNLSGPFPYTDSEHIVVVSATGGNYDLSVDLPSGSEILSVPWNASSVALRTALEGIVGVGNVSVSGGPGNAGGTNPYLIIFDTYGIKTVPGLTVTPDTLAGTIDHTVESEGFAPPLDSWYITYTYGKPVPPDGQYAAAKFACELALAMCGSDACQLPAKLKSVVREGVQMVFSDPLEFIGKGEVGIYEVDLWLNSVNPHKISRRASVYRADAPKPAQRFRRG